MGAHAPLPPSGAPIWGPGGCAAYPRISALFPEDGESPEAREGTAAHHYMAETLLKHSCAVNSLAPNGHPVTEEMVQCARKLIEDVEAIRPRLTRSLAVETRVDMPDVHPDNWGTADVFGIDDVNKTVYLWDFKFGHKYVDVFKHWQMIDYLAGICRAYSIPRTAEWSFRVAIAQPRNYHESGPFREWTLNGEELAWLVADLRAAAHEAMQPDAPARTGEHCTYCEGRHACEALRRAGGASVDLSLKALPHVMGPDAAGLSMSHIAGAIARLKALETGLAAQIMAYRRAGKLVPGWELKATEGREAWTVPIAEVYALGDMMGKDLRKPAEAITPNQAREKGIDASVISAYSKRPTGKLVVVPTDATSAVKAFS